VSALRDIVREAEDLLVVAVVPLDRDLYADIGSSQKVFVDLGCSSHNAMWEKNHALLFKASLEWLDKTTVEGQSNTMLKLGYE